MPRDISSLTSVRSPHHIHTDLDHYFGVAIMGAAIIQAAFGWYHHRRFVQDKPNGRRWFTHVHLWLGRILILCGLANCGFGFPVSNVQYKWAVLWWICSGILVALYLIAYIILAFVQGRETSGESNRISSAPIEMQPQAIRQYDAYRYYPGSGSVPRYPQNIPDQHQPYWVAGSEREFHSSSNPHNFSYRNFDYQ